MSALRPHRLPRTALGLLAVVLAGCTAHMDMTLSEDGTYDVVVDMRDSTGTVLTADTDCEDYADPSLVGASEGASVTSRAVGSADDDGGVGCEVTITGVAVPEAPVEGPSPLVVRDGDLYLVDLSMLQGTDWSGRDAGGHAPQSLAGIVDARVSVTFPGAVVEADGGTVEGSTVTWSDADVLTSGVSASGYARSGAGLNVWDRYSGWIIGAVVLAVGVAAWRRRTAAGRRSGGDVVGARGTGRPRRPKNRGGRSRRRR